MDSLTPDKEDLDRFRQERKKPAAAKPVQGPSRAESVSAPRESNAATVRTPASNAKGGGTGWLVVMVLLLVIAVAVISFWQIFRQQATIDQLQQQLTEASQYINQSKLVVARLEGSLNETEANVTQSGSQLSNRLQTIDSEIRKLWDMTNKRNIELIKASQTKIENLEATAKRLDDQLKVAQQTAASATQTAAEQQARIDAAVRATDELKAKLTQVEQSAIAGLEMRAKESKAQLTALSNKLESLNAAVTKQASVPNADGRLKEVETAIDSIDVNRQQLNRRVVELERRLNETQLKVDSFQAP